jgi:hypothetical protein
VIGRGRQRTAGAVVVAVFLVAALALFAYLFAGVLQTPCRCSLA